MTVEEIEKLYKIPVLGVIGRAKIDSYLAVFEKPKSTIAESFRAYNKYTIPVKKESQSKTILHTSKWRTERLYVPKIWQLFLP